MSGKGAKTGAGNLQQRVISALVLGAVVLALTYLGGLPFRLLAAAIAGAVYYEWQAMRGEKATRAQLYLSVALMAAVLAVALWGVSATLALAALAGALLVLLGHGYATGQGAANAVGFFYALAPALSLIYLRGSDAAGFIAILYLYAVVWTTDIMAYFTGRTLGGPRLAPAISPGKTWSGAIGGAGFAVLAGAAFAFHDLALHGFVAMAATALVLAVVEELGDLLESALKRRHGVKDSSNLIPGHGGVMDRVDGLLAAAIVFYLLGALIAGPDTPAHAFFSPLPS